MPFYLIEASIEQWIKGGVGIGDGIDEEHDLIIPFG